MAGLSLEIRTNPGFQDIPRRLRDAADGKLQKRLYDKIRREGDPTVRAVKDAVRAVHVTSKLGGAGHPKGETHLRERIAGATRVSARPDLGIRIEVVGEQVGAYGEVLTEAMDVRRRWRHPVFGNRKKWETQRGHEFFNSTIRRHEPQFRSGCEEAMHEIALIIEG